MMNASRLGLSAADKRQNIRPTEKARHIEQQNLLGNEDGIFTNTPIKNIYSPGQNDHSPPSESRYSPSHVEAKLSKFEQPGLMNMRSNQDLNEKLDALSKDWSNIK